MFLVLRCAYSPTHHPSLSPFRRAFFSVCAAAVEGFSADSIPRYILAKAAEVLDTTTKLGAGNAVASLADYDNLKIAYAESHQLVIHLIGSKEANSGLMLEMHDEVVYKLRPLMSSFPQQ